MGFVFHHDRTTMEEMMASVEAAAAMEAGAPEAAAAATTVTGHLSADDLAEMKMPDLKALANEMGLEYPGNIKKADLVKLIAAEQVEVDLTDAEVEIVDDEAADAALGVILDEDQTDAEDQTDDQDEDQTDDADVDLDCEDVKLSGRVLVTHTGMVNLRDEDLNVVERAMQGQTFKVVGRRSVEGVTWYRIENQAGDHRLIRADLVRYMAK